MSKRTIFSIIGVFLLLLVGWSYHRSTLPDKPQMLTLYTTPVIYLWLDQFRQRWSRRRAQRQIGYPIASSPPAVA